MATNNAINMHMPKIVQSVFGGVETDGRDEIIVPGKSSAAIYIGQFVQIVDGSYNGCEFGIPAWAAKGLILGFVTNITRNGSNLRIFDDTGRAGTITDATGELPMKYTFSAANDEASTTSANLEMVHIRPIYQGDILEVSLWGASTVSVARGTTTAAGTTNSSANTFVGLTVNSTYPFSLLESSAAKAMQNMDFLTTRVGGNQPVNPKKVYVTPIRTFNAYLPSIN